MRLADGGMDTCLPAAKSVPSLGKDIGHTLQNSEIIN